MRPSADGPQPIRSSPTVLPRLVARTLRVGDPLPPDRYVMLVVRDTGLAI